MIKTLAISVISGAFISTANAEGWEQALDFGATLAKGNSDSVLATIGYAGSNVGGADEYLTSLSYTYGKEEDTKTNDELLGTAQWNHIFEDKFYGGLRANLRMDSLADIDYRLGATALLGYYFVKTDSTYYSVEAGPGYTFEQVGGESDNYVSVYLGQKFEHKFDEKTRVYETFAVTAPADDFDDYSIVFELGVETFLSDRLALKVAIQDKYEAEPASGLKANDFKIITGISYKF